jgi:hypothetical protein
MEVEWEKERKLFLKALLLKHYQPESSIGLFIDIKNRLTDW